ncbi:hypothetical protein MAL04_20100 (plasmid) [Leptospira noguchii]|nr:hypothetical protein MAL04_20100 [Leptospira noguchii]
MSWQEKLEVFRNSPVGSFENYCYSYLEWNRTAKSHSEHTLTNAHAHLKNFRLVRFARDPFRTR